MPYPADSIISAHTIKKAHKPYHLQPLNPNAGLLKPQTPADTQPPFPAPSANLHPRTSATPLAQKRTPSRKAHQQESLEPDARRQTHKHNGDDTNTAKQQTNRPTLANGRTDAGEDRRCRTGRVISTAARSFVGFGVAGRFVVRG